MLSAAQGLDGQFQHRNPLVCSMRTYNDNTPLMNEMYKFDLKMLESNVYGTLLIFTNKRSKSCVSQVKLNARLTNEQFLLSGREYGQFCTSTASILKQLLLVGEAGALRCGMRISPNHLPLSDH